MARPLLLSCEAVSKAYGTRSLFDGLTFGLFEGDQAGLVGPNGSGKSTLLRILGGIETADRGSRSLRGGVRVGYVPQDPVFSAGHTVADIVLGTLAGVDEEDRPGRLAHALSRAGFTDGRTNVEALSGGWKKRLAIARELAAAPDILLMDEPTNHLDVEGILWLEELFTQRARRFIEELQAAGARGVTATAGIAFPSWQRRTRRLLVTRGVTKSLGGRRLVSDLDLVVTPGTRVGLIGPNGSGKTTLLNVLAGSLAPDAGEVDRADDLRIVRFAQERGGLDPDQSLRRALAPEGDAVTWQGRSVHVASWAKRFLFRPEQLEVPVGRLSGGEQARILIASLMREPADVLILDEPTNDLDIPTLEVLEDSLAEFEGGLVLVTHDRFMLERVSTVILALDGEGGTETFADYAQWEAARSAAAPPPRKATSPTPERERARPKRLGYREQREWDGMEQAILDAESAVEACQREADDPTIASDPTALQQRYAALEAARAEVDRLYARWAELEAKSDSSP